MGAGMNIDDKLREILTDVRNEYEVSNDVIAQIHQAFKEAGYSKHDWTISSEGVTFDGTKYHTGQEWYDRYVKELELMTVFTKNPVNKLVAREAAKRAAGLEDEVAND